MCSVTQNARTRIQFFSFFFQSPFAVRHLRRHLCQRIPIDFARTGTKSYTSIRSIGSHADSGGFSRTAAVGCRTTVVENPDAGTFAVEGVRAYSRKSRRVRLVSAGNGRSEKAAGRPLRLVVVTVRVAMTPPPRARARLTSLYERAAESCDTLYGALGWRSAIRVPVFGLRVRACSSSTCSRVRSLSAHSHAHLSGVSTRPAVRLFFVGHRVPARPFRRVAGARTRHGQRKVAATPATGPGERQTDRTRHAGRTETYPNTRAVALAGHGVGGGASEKAPANGSDDDNAANKRENVPDGFSSLAEHRVYDRESHSYAIIRILVYIRHVFPDHDPSNCRSAQGFVISAHYRESCIVFRTHRIRTCVHT